MPKEQNTRYPTPKELVGSVDLRESFRDQDRIRGSFFINGIEMHQFEANSPASVVSQINAKTSAHYVHAEIDDGGHLVLVDKSGAPIKIMQGAAYVDADPASTGTLAKDVVAHLKHEHEKERNEHRGNRILEQLGLEASDKATADETARPGFETGRTAEDRAKAHQESIGQSATPVNPNRPADVRPGGASGSHVPSDPSPGATRGGNELEDGRQRTGTGGGSGETAGATIQRNSQPQGKAPVPGA